MTIYVGDQLVHNLDCDFPPNKDAIDWWTYLDMSEYVGKTAKVVAQAAPEICEMFESSDEIRHLQPLYDEALRPQFHMSQMRGWNNDPNGMCYYDGQYHFFWQCNPAGRNWANMYWGHATSPDMVHWTEHDRALRSFGGDVENRHPKMAVKNCFSGSGNVDLNNTAGWQTGRREDDGPRVHRHRLRRSTGLLERPRQDVDLLRRQPGHQALGPRPETDVVRAGQALGHRRL